MAITIGGGINFGGQVIVGGSDPTSSFTGSLFFNGTNAGADNELVISSATAGSAFAFGTGDYTIETWINPTSVTVSQRLWWFGSNSDNLDLNNNGQLNYYSGSAYPSSASGVVTAGAWQHVALVRASGTVTVYVGGVLVLTSTSVYNSNTNRSLEIGWSAAQNNNPYNGYMTSMRIVKGLAVYTSNFTPSTTPLTAIQNANVNGSPSTAISGTSTQLLLAVASSGTYITDSSSNNFTVTNAGAVFYSTLHP
jgi:hypothetical protein